MLWPLDTVTAEVDGDDGNAALTAIQSTKRATKPYRTYRFFNLRGCCKAEIGP